MGIVSDLIASLGGKPGETQAVIEEKLAALESERRDARDKIAELLARRQSLLISESTDREIAKTDADLDRLRLVIERLDAIEPHLRQRLVEMRDAERVARWKEVSDAHHSALVHHVRALQVALATASTLKAARDAAMGAGFPREAMGLLEPLQHLNDEALRNYLEHVERHDAARAAQK